MEAGVAGNNHFMLYIRTERYTIRQIVAFFPSKLAMHGPCMGFIG